MVAAAIGALKERGGSSRQAILKYVMANYKVGAEAAKINARVKTALKAGVKAGALKQARGTAAAAPFKLGQKPKAVKKPKPRRSRSPRPPPSPRRPLLPKKKKVAKKPKAAKSPAKKAAKPKKAKTPKYKAAGTSYIYILEFIKKRKKKWTLTQSRTLSVP